MIKHALYRLYYKLLFGRRFPFSRALLQIVQSRDMRPPGLLSGSRERWNEQYRDGSLTRLRNEQERYGTVADCLKRLKPGGAILDVGCGEGLLLEHLGAPACSHYLGIDISDVAIAQCAARASKNAALIQCNAENYVPEGTFDVIVFNESLYHFRDALGAVARYQRYLNPGGLIVVSMFVGPRPDGILRRLKQALLLVEQRRIENTRVSWTCCVFRTRSNEGAADG